MFVVRVPNSFDSDQARQSRPGSKLFAKKYQRQRINSFIRHLACALETWFIAYSASIQS